MHRNWMKWLMFAGLSVSMGETSVQRICTTGIYIEGMITDSTDAVIPGAQVQKFGLPW